METFQIAFVFPVNLGKNRGDSIHVKNLVENGLVKESDRLLTKGNSSAVVYYLRILLFGIYKRPGRFYVRYSEGVVTLLELFFPARDIIYEMNAVVTDELRDRGKKSLSIKLALARLDEYLLRKGARRIVCVTQEIANYYGENAIIIENCVNSKLFVPNLNTARPSIDYLFVGTFSPWQDLDLVIEGAQYLSQKRLSFNMVLVGDGEDYERIEKKVKALGLLDSVILTGRLDQSEVVELINSSRYCLVPLKGSRLRKTGSSALKAFEYLSCNKPIILTECGSFSNKWKSLDFASVYKDKHEFFKILEDSIIANRERKIVARPYIIENHSYSSKIVKISNLWREK